MEKTRASEAEVLESVGRVLRGDSAAFGLIVREYQTMVLRICGALLPNRQDTEDAAQEVFYRVFRSLGSFRLDRRFTPWLISIAMNTARSHYRRVGKTAARTSAADPEELPSSSSVELEGERSFTAETVRRAISGLPERLREVVVLYYLEELDVADVSEALGLSKENVKSRLHRARSALRSLLVTDATEDYNRE